MDNKTREKLSRRIGILNGYLHPRFQSIDIVKDNCPSCPASVRYDIEEYEKTVTLFQDVFTYLISTLSSYIQLLGLGKDEEILDAYTTIKSLENIEKEIRQKMIFSKDLRAFISEMQPID